MRVTIEVPDEIIPDGYYPVRYGVPGPDDNLLMSDGKTTSHMSPLSGLHFRPACKVKKQQPKADMLEDWITNRKPTKKDAPQRGGRVITRNQHGIVRTDHFFNVKDGQPWIPCPVYCLKESPSVFDSHRSRRRSQRVAVDGENLDPPGPASGAEAAGHR